MNKTLLGAVFAAALAGGVTYAVECVVPQGHPTGPVEQAGGTGCTLVTPCSTYQSCPTNDTCVSNACGYDYCTTMGTANLSCVTYIGGTCNTGTLTCSGGTSTGPNNVMVPVVFLKGVGDCGNCLPPPGGDN